MDILFLIDGRIFRRTFRERVSSTGVASHAQTGAIRGIMPASTSPDRDRTGADRDRDRTGQVAVIFLSTRTAADPDGYAAAAAAMEALSAAQPGFRGLDSARGENGFGITVSWWADEAAAAAWRDHPVHAAVRAAGRDLWYADYEAAVATVGRSYQWRAPA